MHLAIYDLDRTLTKRGTFTPFLIFAAKRHAPWRLIALPFWVGAMACHKAGLIARKPLKQFGLRLFIGRTISGPEADRLALAYATHTLAHNVQPAALDQIAADSAAGRMLVLATAAPNFYAEAIGKALGFKAIVATRHIRMPDGAIFNRIDGENCYGPHKLAMIEAWLSTTSEAPTTTRFYSDHISDAPVLDWAGEAFFVNGSAAQRNVAIKHGWRTIEFHGPGHS